MRTRALAILTAVLAVAASHAAWPGAVVASGRVFVSHDVCDSIGSGDVALRLTPATPGSPTDLWHVSVGAQSVSGCSASAKGICLGKGTLAEGVTFTGCVGTVAAGHFGPVVVCYPGPARPQGHAIAYNVPVFLDGDGGNFDGNIRADLFGTAVDEAQNICV